MQFNLQIWLNYTLVLLALAGGLVAGMLAGRLIHLAFSEEGAYLAPTVVQPALTRRLQEEDLQVILSRSLFDAEGIGSAFTRLDMSDVSLDSDPQPTTTNIDNLSLLGTVVAGEFSLALIQADGEVKVFGLAGEVAPGVTIDSIERRKVVLLDRGERRDLMLVEQQASAPAPRTNGQRSTAAPAETAADSTQDGIVALGEGRFRVDRGMVDNARSNMGALLQSARMIPQMENGQTAGFRLVGMQRGSLLEQLGLRLGDVVVEINRIKLDSPEKALQVFQQVREANNISLGLIRNGQPQTFEYSLE